MAEVKVNGSSLFGSVSLLTHNGENYHHKVKDVPCNGEEITTEGKDLDQAFGGEDHDEDQVDLVEDGLHAIWLLICFHHHGHHVDDDEHHDYDVKGLLGHEIEEEGLENVLGLGNTNGKSVSEYNIIRIILFRIFAGKMINMESTYTNILYMKVCC